MVIQDTSAQTFLDQVEPLLLKDEAANSLMLGLSMDFVAGTRPGPQSPVFLRVTSHGKTRTAALRTPPYNLILMTSADEDLLQLANHLHDSAATLPGVIGPPREVDAFAHMWSGLAGAKVLQTIDQRIYRLDHVTGLRPATGNMAKARTSEAALLAQWFHEFALEALPHETRTSEEYLAQILPRIVNQQAYVWKDGDAIVSMAFATRPTRHGISIGPVYTPLALRGKGFASALVGALSQAMLNSGKKFCVLYTDLSNPTSNRIYINLGYRPVADSRYLIFK